MEKESINVVAACFALLVACVVLGIVIYASYEEVEDPVVVDPLDKFLPVNSETRAVGFTNAILEFPCEGLSSDGFPLTFSTSVPYDQEVNEYGYYGNRVTTLIDGESTIVGFVSFVECFVTNEWYDEEHTKPKSGSVVYQLNFDPNNGYIAEEICDYITYPDFCPKDENGEFVFIGYRGWKENLDYETYKAIPYSGN